MDMDGRAKRGRTDETTDPNGEEGVKRNGIGEKIVVQKLKNAWPETSQKEDGEKKKRRGKEKDEQKKSNTTPRPESQIQELKTLVEMVIDDAERDRSAEINLPQKHHMRCKKA